MNDSNRESTPATGSPGSQPSAQRQGPKLLFALVCLVTATALVVTLAVRRNAVAAANPPANPLLSPERAAAEKLVPPSVPDDQNFAATPYLAKYLDKATAGESRDRWPDDFSRADRWPRRYPPLADTTDGRQTGRVRWDLLAWKMAFASSQEHPGPAEPNDEIIVSDRPDAGTNAQAAAFVLDALKPYAPVLDELRAARSRPSSRFAIRYDWQNPWGILLPHLAIVKQTVVLLRLKAVAELAAGHSEQGLQDVLLALRLTDSARSEPTLLSQLVRVATLEITMQPIWEGLAARRWSEPQLQTLQATLQSMDFIADLQHALEAEKVWGNLTIALFRDHQSPASFSSLVSEDGSPAAWIKEVDKAIGDAPRAWFDSEQRTFNRIYDQRMFPGIDVAARRVDSRRIDENARETERELRGDKTVVQDHRAFAKAFVVPPGKVHLKLAGAQGSVNLAVVACALERHRSATGAYPKTLSGLTPRFLPKIPHDVVNGEPLHYGLNDDGTFLLYSVGWNGTDDGGEVAFIASGQSPERKEGDWVWRHPATAQPATGSGAGK